MDGKREKLSLHNKHTKRQKLSGNSPNNANFIANKFYFMGPGESV
jgi:hypothetical protein